MHCNTILEGRDDELGQSGSMSRLVAKPSDLLFPINDIASGEYLTTSFEVQACSFNVTFDGYFEIGNRNGPYTFYRCQCARFDLAL